MSDKDTRRNQQEQVHTPGHPHVEREVNELFATLKELDGWYLGGVDIDLECAESRGGRVTNKQINIDLNLVNEVNNYD